MYQRYELHGDAPYEDFLLEFKFLPQDAEYPRMARVYRECVAAVKRGYDEYEALSDLQFEFMDDHRMLADDVSLLRIPTELGSS